MLDPVQARVLEHARARPVRVSGFPGSGRSYLARAIAEDAARRGKSCLLVGASPVLDVPIGPSARPPRLHQVLARRAAGPVAVEAPPTGAGPGDDALRAALDPDGAAAALRLHARAVEILAVHALDPLEVEAAGGPHDDPALGTAFALAVSDARSAATGIWRGGAAGRTLGDVVAAASGRAVGADAIHAALVLDPGPVEDRLRALAGGDGRPDAEGDALRAALDPWAWRPELRDVGDARDWAARQAGLFETVAALLRRSGSHEAAESDPDAPEAALRTLGVLRSRFPDRTFEEGLIACERIGQAHRTQARGLEPFMALHAGRPLADLAARPARPPHRTPHRLDPQPLREARAALRRLAQAADSLGHRIDADRWRAALDTSLDVLSGGLPPRGSDARAAAAVEMREIRAAFSDLGYGDVLAAGDFPARVSGASLSPPRAARAGSSPGFLDLLLPGVPTDDAAAPAHHDGIQRVRGEGDLPGVGDDYDVVVIDDEADVADAVMAAVDGIGSLVHALGVAAGDSDGFALAHPHRQRDVALANVAAGLARTPFWLGGPRGAGFVVRRVGHEAVPDLAPAARALADALAAAGYGVAVLGGEDPGRMAADLVVAYADDVDDAMLLKAACSARDGAVLVCRTLSARLPEIRSEGDDAGLGAHGWSLAADVGEGRIFVRDGKSAVLVREPAWNDLASETVAERAARVAGLGWRPVVDWIGAPRRPADLDGLLAAAAVAPDPRMRRIMEGHPLG